jgi:two-component system sensor histidine kinase RegB
VEMRESLLLPPATRPARPKVDGESVLRVRQEPEIVLTWLVRLRWLAVLGQVVATTVAHEILGLQIAVTPIGCVILLTLLSNAAIVQLMWAGLARAWLVPAVLVLDVCFLTALLYFSGGTENPFATLYIVHIVMSVAVLRPLWTWLLVGVACLSFALLLFVHQPLTMGEPLSRVIAALGQWTSFALVAVLIGYFVGRITRSLRDREHELTATRERAARSEQLASLTTLAAGAAHELGTPLGTIAVIAKELELASERGESGEAITDDARLIRQEVERCRKILDRMRVDIVEDLHQRTTTQEMGEFLDLVRSDLPEDDARRLVVNYPPAVSKVTGPMRAIQQSVGVLLRNAFDATPDDRHVKLEISQVLRRTVFVVEDSGTGMSEDVLRRAGQPFFTTKPPGKGMGLGLFLVRLVAERYGGKFELQSKPGVGTRSRLEIPERDERGEGEDPGGR